MTETLKGDNCTKMNNYFLQCLTVIYLLSFAFQSAYRGVFVSNIAASIRTEKTRIEGRGYIEFYYENYRPGDILIINVVSEYPGTTGWLINVIDEINLSRFNQGLSYKDLSQSGPAPTMRFLVQNAGKQNIFIFNKSEKVALVTYTIIGFRHLTPKETESLKSPLEGRYAAAKASFNFPGFDIQVVPCGETNAFSSPTITICTELVSYLVSRRQLGALWPIFYHELAHSLLKVWGDSRYSNEETADELGIALGFLLDPNARQNLSIMAAWLSNFDTTNEFLGRALFGDNHPFSIDRIKKLFDVILATEQPEIVTRWIRFLVPHMTKRMLKWHIDDPKSPIREDAMREMANRGFK